MKIPVVRRELRDVISDSKAAFRQLLYHSNLFEDFGFDYLGPVDGHDIPALVQALRRAKELEKPVVLHVNTVKGKGYAFAGKKPRPIPWGGRLRPGEREAQGPFRELFLGVWAGAGPARAPG